MNIHTRNETIPRMLLEQTINRYIAAESHITQVESVILEGGMSGATIQRHIICYSTPGGDFTTRLITKDADRHEWKVLQHLTAQQQPNVPFAYAIDDESAERVLICMRDVGDTNRPSSLDPITKEQLRREAVGIASIHNAHFELQSNPNGLPRMDRDYIEDMIYQRAWRPAWEATIANNDFHDTFRNAIPRVEAAAAHIVNDMAGLLAEANAQTLIHADLNPSNVLVQDGIPYFIDWQTAMRGPLYVDLPHHHCTLTQAEHYRLALAQFGHVVSPGDFAERYRVAARYIGLRYMWWTLEYWLGDHSQTPWVQHYIGLITGE